MGQAQMTTGTARLGLIVPEWQWAMLKTGEARLGLIVPEWQWAMLKTGEARLGETMCACRLLFTTQAVKS